MLPSAGCITVETLTGASVLKMGGEIDAETVSAYEREQSSVVEGVAAVDLSEVRFLSSSAVSFLIRQTRSVRDRGELPTLCGVSGPARRVLELVGAMSLFEVSF